MSEGHRFGILRATCQALCAGSLAPRRRSLRHQFKMQEGDCRPARHRPRNKNGYVVKGDLKGGVPFNFPSREYPQQVAPKLPKLLP